MLDQKCQRKCMVDSKTCMVDSRSRHGLAEAYLLDMVMGRVEEATTVPRRCYGVVEMKCKV